MRIRFSEQQRQRMKQMYEADECPIAKIAMNFGVSVPTIANHLREMGVAIKSRGRRPNKPKTPLIEEEPIVAPAPERFTEIFDG